MSQRSAQLAVATAPVSDADRRIARRLRAEDVPWIVSVKPNLGESAKLIDISRSGLLMETRHRFLPGRKCMILVGMSEGRTERLEGEVVRSHLSVISGGPLYRIGFTFSSHQDALLINPDGSPAVEPPAVKPPAAEEPLNDVVTFPQGPHSDEIFEGLWTTESASSLVTITNLSEMGCLVRTDDAVSAGQWASVTIFFSAARRQLLTGQVAGTSPEGCVLRFERLTAEQRRALRVEVFTSRAGRSSQPPAVEARRPLLAEVTRAVPARGGSLRANSW